jgi:hypothetical protein
MTIAIAPLTGLGAGLAAILSYEVAWDSGTA